MIQRSILLLSSSRVHGFGFLEQARELITQFLKNKNVQTVLFVPYANKDHVAYTKLVTDTLEPWGFQVIGLNDTPNPIDAVENAQAIFIGGGNTFVLLKTLCEKQLLEPIRRRVLEYGVPYMGSSAGTNVATRSIHTTNDMPVEFPPTFNALKLVPFNINPHYVETDIDSKHKGETRDERLIEFMSYHNRPVLGLREGTSVLIQNDKATLKGDRTAKLFHPEKEPTEYEPESDLSFLLNEQDK